MKNFLSFGLHQKTTDAYMRFAALIYWKIFPGILLQNTPLANLIIVILSAEMRDARIRATQSKKKYFALHLLFSGPNFFFFFFVCFLFCFFLFFFFFFFFVVLFVFFFFCFFCFLIFVIWASSWDYGTYHVGDQRRLSRAYASAQSRQSAVRTHEVWKSTKGPTKNQMSSPLDGCILKNVFTVDEKCHDLMSWLIKCT